MIKVKIGKKAAGKLYTNIHSFIRKKCPSLYLFLRKNQKKTRLLLLGAGTLSLLLLLQLFLTKDPFVRKDGKITGARIGTGESVLLEVEARSDAEVVNRSVQLKNASETVKKQNKEASLPEKDVLKMELDEAVRRAEEGAGKKVIPLPEKTASGYALTWREPQGAPLFLLPIPLAIVLIFLSYRSEEDRKKRKMNEENASIVEAIPSFNNKLVLLLGSGLIFDDVFQRVLQSYEQGKETVFSACLKRVQEEAVSTGGDAFALLGAFASRRQIKELMRLTSLINDSRSGGADLREKLRIEGQDLWQKRKKNAEVKGKLAETGMSLPLAILLLSLLAVTAAPALMQM